MTPELREQEVHVWTAALDATSGFGYSGLLGDEEQARASRLRDPADRSRYVVTHGVLRRLLAEYLGESPEALRFFHGPRGKPELARQGGVPALSFNLSHARRWVAVALARSMPVGVDVEQLDAAVDADGMARLVMSASEQATLAALTPAQRRRSFLAAWVCKEAVLKATGHGLGDGAQRIELPRAVLAGGCGGTGGGFDFVVEYEGSWRVRSLDFAGDCIGAVAAPDVGWTLRCLSFGAPRA
jgi:4'-phosphopantetheinyl transferase